jgi:3-oxosteroid 1-dehydrogenase
MTIWTDHPQTTVDDTQAVGSRISRRTFLKVGGAGALAAGTAGSVVFEQSSAHGRVAWDKEADVVVVGSGAAGCAAALFAHETKASVVLLEKAPIFGGTTAKSGGVFWIPNNYLMREKGVIDSREGLLRYLARVSFPTLYNPRDTARFGMPEDIHQLHAVFYDNASATIDGLTEMGLKCQPWMDWDNIHPMPDYNSQLPENRDVHWRALLPNTADSLQSGGAALIRQLKGMIDQRTIPILLSHRVVRLVVNAKGEVVGVEAMNEDEKTVTVRARRGVIFGSGGFTGNVEMCLNYLRGPIFGGCGVPTCEGDLIPMATAVRAKLANMNNAWWWPVIVEQALQFRSVPTGIDQIPGDSSILVNAYGRRCVNEKIQYNERTQAHFVWDPVRARYPNHIMFMIYDQSCRERFGNSPEAIFEGLIVKAGVTAPYILSAQTLPDLANVIQKRLIEIADRTGNYQLEPDFIANLAQTVDRFNQFARTGVDLDFHRGEAPVELAFHGNPEGNTGPNVTMRPISPTGPYYAVMVGGGTLDTKGGPKIDSNAQILDMNEQPIQGLYGAGNCIASPAGQAYWSGGVTIGSALTFGAIAGKAVAKAPVNAI